LSSVTDRNWSKWRFKTSGFSAFFCTAALGLRLILWNSGWRCSHRVGHAWLRGAGGDDSSVSCCRSLFPDDLITFSRGCSPRRINLLR
jgi:hypothetical protein